MIGFSGWPGAVAAAASHVTPIPVSPAQQLIRDAIEAATLAAKVYHPAVAKVVAEQIGWMRQSGWLGEASKLRELIDGVNADAARLRSEAA